MIILFHPICRDRGVVGGKECKEVLVGDLHHRSKETGSGEPFSFIQILRWSFFLWTVPMLADPPKKNLRKKEIRVSLLGTARSARIWISLPFSPLPPLHHEKMLIHQQQEISTMVA